MFAMDSNSGILFVAGNPDAESTSQHNHYNLIVRVTNGKESSDTQIDIRIKDVNDHRPRFDSDLYEVRIPESLTLNANVVQLRAIDEDIDESNRNLVFRILHAAERDSLSKFKIDDEGMYG